MSQGNTEFWNRARLARDKLVGQFLDHPDVDLIDIGHPMEGGEITEKKLVLRVHVRERWMEASPDERLAFPDQVDGISVVVMLGEYRRETGDPAADGARHPSSRLRSEERQNGN